MNKSCPFLAHTPGPPDFPVIKEQTPTQRCLSDHSFPHTGYFPLPQHSPERPSNGSARWLPLSAWPWWAAGGHSKAVPKALGWAGLCWGSCTRGPAPHSLQHPAPSSAPHCAGEYGIPCWHLSQRPRITSLINKVFVFFTSSGIF